MTQQYFIQEEKPATIVDNIISIVCILLIVSTVVVIAVLLVKKLSNKPSESPAVDTPNGGVTSADNPILNNDVVYIENPTPKTIYDGDKGTISYTHMPTPAYTDPAPAYTDPAPAYVPLTPTPAYVPLTPTPAYVPLTPTPAYVPLTPTPAYTDPAPAYTDPAPAYTDPTPSVNPIAITVYKPNNNLLNVLDLAPPSRYIKTIEITKDSTNAKVVKEDSKTFAIGEARVFNEAGKLLKAADFESAVYTRGDGKYTIRFPASNAIDGNISTLAHTSGDGNIHTLTLKLKTPTILRKVDVYNRIGSNAIRLIGAVITLKDVNGNIIKSQVLDERLLQSIKY
jgi:hypothetical protein